MWSLMEKRLNCTVSNLTIFLPIDISSSFYVGDAGGRIHKDGKKDHSNSDLLFAKEVKCEFYTPEQFFQRFSIFKM